MSGLFQPRAKGAITIQLAALGDALGLICSVFESSARSSSVKVSCSSSRDAAASRSGRYVLISSRADAKSVVHDLANGRVDRTRRIVAVRSLRRRAGCCGEKGRRSSSRDDRDLLHGILPGQTTPYERMTALVPCDSAALDRIEQTIAKSAGNVDLLACRIASLGWTHLDAAGGRAEHVVPGSRATAYICRRQL